LTHRAAIGLGRLSVHEEVHLLASNLLEMVLERVDAGCFNCFLTETVPSVYASLRKEVESIHTDSRSRLRDVSGDVIT